jgi:hypothetical protein
VFVIELRDSAVFSLLQTVMEFKELGEFRLSYVRLEIQSVRFVSFSILFLTLHIP